MLNETMKPSRRRRSDAGSIDLNDRDIFALTWIGQQYTIRLDHLRRLLGQQAGRGAAHPDQISEGATRDVVTRWKKAGLVQTEQIRAKQPFWIWPTRLALRKLGLPYEYKNIGQTTLDELDHLAAINEIRLKEADGDEDIEWISERQLSQGIIREKGKEILHTVTSALSLFSWFCRLIILYSFGESCSRLSLRRETANNDFGVSRG